MAQTVVQAFLVTRDQATSDRKATVPDGYTVVGVTSGVIEGQHGVWVLATASV